MYQVYGIRGQSAGGMGGLFLSLLPCMNRHELSLDGWII